MEGKMVRKQIYIQANQDALLKETAAKYATSEGELVRIALSKHLRAGGTPAGILNYVAWQQERSFIEEQRRPCLAGQEPISTETQRWRREDVYDR